LETESRLGTFLTSTSRPMQALPYLEKAKDACLKTKGPDDPFYTPQMLLQYGMALQNIGRPEEALRYVSSAVENRRKNRPGTLYLGRMLENQASVLTDLGRYQRARQLLEEAAKIRVKVGQKEDRNFIAPRLKLAFAEGDREEAGRLIDHFYEPIPDSAPMSMQLLQNMQSRAQLALLENNGKLAISIARHLGDVIRSNHLEIYLRLWQTTAGLLEGEGRIVEHDPWGAVRVLQLAMQGQAEIFDPASPASIQAQALLGIAYFDCGDRQKARDQLTKVQGKLRTHPELSDYYLRPQRTLAARLAGVHRAVASSTKN